jgi:hypothetical protein
MKFALVNNVEVEAVKRAHGTCICCGSEVIAKCGEVKVNHWAHKGGAIAIHGGRMKRNGNRAWKNNFASEWQEVVLTDERTGEKHIADLKTEPGSDLRCASNRVLY